MKLILRISQFINFFCILVWFALGVYTIIADIALLNDSKYRDWSEISDLGNFNIIALSYYIGAKKLSIKISIAIGALQVISALFGFVSLCKSHRKSAICYLVLLTIYFIYYLSSTIYGIIEDKGETSDTSSGWIFSAFTFVHIFVISCMIWNRKYKYYDGSKQATDKDENGYARTKYTVN